jgi:hypothetical protein
VIFKKRRSEAALEEDPMRLSQHLFYAIAALIGVTLLAIQDPSFALAMETVDGPAAACQSDHLERPCDPGIQVAGVMESGRVIAR